MKQEEIWTCPFCEKDTIKVLVFPSVRSFKSSKTASLLGKGSFHKSKEVVLFQSNCSNCNKSKEEIEKWYQKES